MATPKDPYYYSGDVMNALNQQALSGRRFSTPQAIQGAVEGGVNAQIQERKYMDELALRQKQEHNAEVAARTGAITSGITGGAAIFLSTPLAMKTWAQYKALSAPAASGTGTAVSGTGTAVSGTGTAVSGTGTAGAMGSGEVSTTGAGMGTQQAITGVVTKAPAPPETPGIMSSTGAATAGVALGGGIVGGALGRNLIHGKQRGTATDIGTIGGAAGAGALYGGMVTNGVGAPVGAVIGAGVGTVQIIAKHVSIICSELGRQGLLDDSMLRASTIHVLKHVDNDVYVGYLMVASPIVNLMRRSKIVTMLAYPYGKIMCRECASRTRPDVYSSTIVGRTTYLISEWVFRKVAKMRKGEVMYA